MCESFPENLKNLFQFEEEVRATSVTLIAQDPDLQLHLDLVEATMNVADTLRQCPTQDDDFAVVQVLAMRLFNGFAASLKLVVSGYGQIGAQIVRDLLETSFLLDFFSGDRAAISEWRGADRKQRIKKFGPLHIRMALDTRDGLQEEKRRVAYELLSELAAHPTTLSPIMMRPEAGGPAKIGPFTNAKALTALLSELGKQAAHAGNILIAFLPKEHAEACAAAGTFKAKKACWTKKFWDN
ncbi:MAG: hypothetical protein AAFY56_10285 [Pseudomonadota bacterium]